MLSFVAGTFFYEDKDISVEFPPINPSFAEVQDMNISVEFPPIQGWDATGSRDL